MKHKIFEGHGQIEEYFCEHKNDSGNSQRNYGLDRLNEFYPTGSIFVYFLDDEGKKNRDSPIQIMQLHQ